MVLIAAGVVLWLVLGQRAPTGPFAILRDQNTNEIVSCKLQQGIDLNTRPALPWDFYQLELPEGWQHEVDAAQSANRLSDIYEDHYLDEQLKEIVFLQSPAFLDWELFRPGARWDIPQQLQEVWFGDRQLMYGKGENEDGETTLLYWVQGNSLLYLRYSGDVEINRMLELVTLVEETPTRQPIYSNLTLHRAIVMPGELLIVKQSNGTGGNPPLPEETDSWDAPAFASVPAGYTLSSEEEGDPENADLTWSWEYQSQQGDALLLSCTLGSANFFTDLNPSDPKAFHGIPRSQLGDSSLVQDGQVNGSPALLYLGEEESSIGWVVGIFTVELRSKAPMTAEELIALAQTVA